MGYYLGLGGWAGVFAVPNSIIDTHIKSVGEYQLKVILWALRHGGEVFSAERIAAETGIPKPLIGDAFNYWIKAGIIKTDGNNLVPENEVPQVPQTVPEQSKLQTTVNKRMLRPDGIYIAKRIQEDSELSQLMNECEMSLGKTISPSLAAVIINAHDDYNLPCGVIMLIISYAKSIGKTGTAYLEALTKNWSEEGIFTLQAAEKKLGELSERTTAWKKISSCLGIPLRTPTKKEDEFSYKWIFTFGFSMDIIKESYERCVNNTGKLQMSYMDKILEKWYFKGLSTISEILEYEDSRKAKGKEKNSPTYDIDELEKMNAFDNLQ